MPLLSKHRPFKNKITDFIFREIFFKSRKIKQKVLSSNIPSLSPPSHAVYTIINILH